MLYNIYVIVIIISYFKPSYGVDYLFGVNRILTLGRVIILRHPLMIVFTIIMKKTALYFTYLLIF
ncbi:hypothetical protein H8356DRAFT_1621397 [Neocallimastix lanati (nom. inval.)]|nr:hypothetical protein H8356DRAFT_1621397 [Neocallimastix sp. JGI-2020a]